MLNLNLLKNKITTGYEFSIECIWFCLQISRKEKKYTRSLEMLNDTNFTFICVLYTDSIPTESDLSSLLKIHYYLVFNLNVHGLSSFIYAK